MTRIASVVLLAATCAVGCGKHEPSGAANATSDTNASTAPGPMATPASPDQIAGASIEATLADLTRELHRTMIRRKLSGGFEEFVAVRNLTVPPPPTGKKYAISKQWRVILVDK